MSGSKYLQSSVHLFLANFAVASLKSVVNYELFLAKSDIRHVLASIPEGPVAPFVSMAALLTNSTVFLRKSLGVIVFSLPEELLQWLVTILDVSISFF